MITKAKIPILGSKAVIFQNKYDVWQFRMYVKQARRYVEKSLRTKEQALAEERAEDLYIEIRNDIKNGKSFFAISIKEGVQMYLEYRKQDVGVADVGIVEGRNRTIVTHLNLCQSLCLSALFNSFSNLCFDFSITQVPQHYQ